MTTLKIKKYFGRATHQNKIHRQIFKIQHSVIIMINKNIIRREIIQRCVLLLYVAVDEGSSIKEELDNEKTKIMETGGKAHTTLLSVLHEHFLTLSF